jgi:hypothetical protein
MTISTCWSISARSETDAPSAKEPRCRRPSWRSASQRDQGSRAIAASRHSNRLGPAGPDSGCGTADSRGSGLASDAAPSLSPGLGGTRKLGGEGGHGPSPCAGDPHSVSRQYPADRCTSCQATQTASLGGACPARPERFELPTFGSVDRRSIQLSYGRLVYFCLQIGTFGAGEATHAGEATAGGRNPSIPMNMWH